MPVIEDDFGQQSLEVKANFLYRTKQIIRATPLKLSVFGFKDLPVTLGLKMPVFFICR